MGDERAGAGGEVNSGKAYLYDVSRIPEPASLPLLLGAGALLLAGRRKRL